MRLNRIIKFLKHGRKESAENAGFRAGDVYQALAASSEKALTVAEIAKAANISTEDVILGIGWLFKEGKIKDEDNKVALA